MKRDGTVALVWTRIEQIYPDLVDPGQRGSPATFRSQPFEA